VTKRARTAQIARHARVPCELSSGDRPHNCELWGLSLVTSSASRPAARPGTPDLEQGSAPPCDPACSPRLAAARGGGEPACGRHTPRPDGELWGLTLVACATS